MFNFNRSGLYTLNFYSTFPVILASYSQEEQDMIDTEEFSDMKQIIMWCEENEIAFQILRPQPTYRYILK